jgi:glycerophosphoryl diester phosphodiesterase
VTAPGWLTEVPLAHRGLHGGAVVENSLAAFAAAAGAGYGIELDVRLSLDGHVVVVHDDDLGRACGTALSVAASPLARIRTLRLVGCDEPVPTLAEALAVVDGRVPVMVEVKNDGRGVGPLESAVARQLATTRGPVCVASFNPRTVGWFARRAPGVVRGQTAAELRDVDLPAVARRALAGMAANRFTRPHFVSYQLEGLPNPACNRWRAAGRPLVTWTVRTPDELVEARAVADNVIFESVRPGPAGAAARPS